MRTGSVTLAAIGLIVLSSCSGGTGRASASGEISRACLAAGRSAANPQLCGCVQQVANQTLSQSDRNRIAGFFADPEVAHAVRINDAPWADAFWERYQAYTDTARRVCG
ncbi:MAG: arginine transporter [Paracoccaceae bacterium]